MSQATSNVRPVVLIVRDGWGEAPNHNADASNAIRLAKTPRCTALSAKYPTTFIATSGFDVGLPEGTMGNSEVGHQNIGAGRVVDQESVRITKDARAGAFAKNAEFVAAIESAKKNNTNLHLMGIASDGGVHGLLEHLYALAGASKTLGLTRVYVHLFTDGRDTPPNSGREYIASIDAKLKEIGVGQIATIVGRYWAMDRDNRWDRVEKAYRALTTGEGSSFASAGDALEHYYAHPSKPEMAGDEFVAPSILLDSNKQQLPRIRDNDSVIFYNFRGDRPRELTHAFVTDTFDGFARTKLKLHFVTMTGYEEGLAVKVAYVRPAKMKNILGEYLSNLRLKQFRVAETEKFPHVTFFFNDYREPVFTGEERYMAKSPKDVATYDLKPEMAAYDIAENAAKAILSRQYAFVLVNFANCDMVGHTGKLSAAIKACEVVDECVGKLVDAAQSVGASLVITADHGNAEQMIDPSTGGPHTAHTTFPVEIVVVDDRFIGTSLKTGGRLADVAPTVLKLMGLSQPVEMTGQSLC
jgi:2,3-bisphosphoglycerate-independent phosphoglycerate mutase